MTYKKLQTNFERELLFQIIQGLRSGKIDQAKAKILARYFLPTLKSESEEEFIDKISKFCLFYPVLSTAFITIVKKYEEEMVVKNLQKTRSQIGSVIGGDKNYGN